MGEFDMYRQAGTTPNFTDIARRYGMHRHTVAKYWKAGGQVEDARRCRPSGLDRHREVIEAKAQLPGATKRGIYEYLLDRCYAGEEPPAYNTLTKWMRRNGIECGRPPEGPEPHPRFETAPGEQMQFDWKESLRMADAEGEVFEFNVFSATLGYSRLHRFVYSRTRTEDDVMACLLAVMAANGGTARTLVTDNMSSIVSSSASGRRVSARFARFAAAAGFELELARPRSPQTKGKVESSNRFLSRLAVYEGDFRGEEGLASRRGATPSPARRPGCRRRCCSCARRRSCARWATWVFWSRWWPTSPSRRCPPRCSSAAGAASSRCPGAA